MVIASLTFFLLSVDVGIVNKISLSMGREATSYLTNPNNFWIILISQNLWKDAGWDAILFLAAMSGIDPTLYEAAVVDGASRFQQIWHITLPCIRATIVTMLILRLGQIFSIGFEQVLLMSNPSVIDVAEVLDKQVSEKMGWTYLILTPYSVFYHIPKLVLCLNLLLVSTPFVVSIPLTLELSRKSRNTISNIMNILSAAENDCALSLGSLKPDSYDYIIHSILDTFIEHKVFCLQLDEKRYQMQVLELQALQAQINPHFLFNPLHTINWKVIALTHGPNEASEMIESLSTILNYSLREPMQVVPLKEEIASAKCYLRIIQARFQSRVSVTWSHEPMPSDCYVPKLLFQPLIENSISHGFSGSNGTLQLRLSIRAEDNCLLLSVEDNGLGMPREKLAEITEQIHSHSFPDSRHMGLLNIAHRLYLLFGKADVLIESAEGTGTRVTMKLPADKLH